MVCKEAMIISLLALSCKQTSYLSINECHILGQQVVEEILDAQAPGCIPEYEFIKVPKCHPLYDPDCRGERFIPFLRNRYDFQTGYAPNNPRMQLNEITPWFDGGLMYGPFKAWTDAIRSFTGGELAANDQTANLGDQYPQLNDELGLPYANPPPPFNNSLFPVNRFRSKLWVDVGVCVHDSETSISRDRF